MEKDEFNGYNLTESWFSFFEITEKKVLPIHTHLAIYIIRIWNNIGKKKEIGIPTDYTMDRLKIGSYKTYKKTLDDLVEFGFIEYTYKTKNHHHSNKITLVNFTKVINKEGVKLNSKESAYITTEDTATIINTTNELNNSNKYKSIIDDKSSIGVEKMKLSFELDSCEYQSERKEKEKKPAPKKEKEIEVIFPFDSEDFKSQWNQWKEYKLKEFRFKYKSEQSEQAALKELSNLSSNNEQTAIAIIHQSMAKRWQGLFKLKDNQIQKSDSTHRQSANDAVNKLFGAPKKSYVFSAERAMETILNQKPPEEK
jgi:hypothetical protein